MAKKLVSVWLSLTILLFSSISIYAGDTVRGQFFLKNISINGTQIFNYELNNPLFTYKGATYVPLACGMKKALGIEAEMDWESRTLKLWNSKPAQKGARDGKLQSNLQDVTAEIASGITVIAYEPTEKKVAVTTEGGVEETEADAAAEDFGEGRADPEPEPKAQAAEAETEGDAVQEEVDEIVVPELQATKLNLGELPLLVKGDIVYFPIKVLTQNKQFGWSLYYDEYSGLYIRTDGDVDAKSDFNELQSRYIRGLVNYIRKHNSSQSISQAQDLVAIFQHEARVYNVDHTLLMAMAQKESGFNAKARGGGGSLGMMQILPSTAKAYGISPKQLYDPHVNIAFGAKYIKDRLDMFGGNAVKALSAYNQGVVAVSRGTNSTRYAGRILAAQKTLKEFLAENGYGKGY